MNFREGERERETEGEREPQAGSTPSMEPNTGLKLTTLRSRAACSTIGASQAPLTA